MYGGASPAFSVARMHRLSLTLLAFFVPVGIRAQEVRPTPAPQIGPNEVSLSAEPVAAGAQYLRRLANAVHLGMAVTVGPLHGVTLSSVESGRLREWATAYPVLAYRHSSGLQGFLSPIGAALAVGDDFGSVYPSAQAGAELARGRLRVGSALRVIRIAAANGRGDYWAQWVPVRLGYAFTW